MGVRHDAVVTTCFTPFDHVMTCFAGFGPGAGDASPQPSTSGAAVGGPFVFGQSGAVLLMQHVVNTWSVDCQGVSAGCFIYNASIHVSGSSFGQTSAWPTFGKSSDKDKPGGGRQGGGGGGGHKAPPAPERVDSLRPDIPPELQGVSVKDLVKALGESLQPSLQRVRSARGSIHVFSAASTQL